MTVNTYFSKAINEPSFKAFIKANPNRFSSGEDMAIFYLLMAEMSYIGISKKEFHNFISSLIDCVGYTQLSFPSLSIYLWHFGHSSMMFLGSLANALDNSLSPRGPFSESPMMCANSEILHLSNVIPCLYKGLLHPLNSHRPAAFHQTSCCISFGILVLLIRLELTICIPIK